jgi:hypothetical protein
MAAKQPNIFVLWGDDIGTWNVAYFSRGQMGYRTTEDAVQELLADLQKAHAA